MICAHVFHARIKAAAILALALAAGGCVTTGSQHVKTGNERLQASLKSVATFEEIEFQPVEMHKPLRFAIDENSPHIVTDGRKRFLKGFRLPAWSGSYVLKLASYRLGTPTDPAVLYPDVRVLDARLSGSGRDSRVQLFVSDHAGR